MPMPGCRGRMRYAHELEIACGYYFQKEANVSSHAVAFEFFSEHRCTMSISVLFLYKENHALDAWFNKAYGGE